MKVGIITITKNLNLGNRLQNYALEQYLQKLGTHSETILNTYACDHLMELSHFKRLGRYFYINRKNFLIYKEK